MHNFAVNCLSLKTLFETYLYDRQKYIETVFKIPDKLKLVSNVRN